RPRHAAPRDGQARRKARARVAVHRGRHGSRARRRALSTYNKGMDMGKEGEVIDQPLVEQEIWRDRSRPIIKRIAFVSGGMGGIGSAICRRLGQTGHTVVAGCLPGYEKKDEWIAAMRKAGYRVHAAEGDVA